MQLRKIKENKTAMQRLKKVATSVLKARCHRVSESQGMDGLQQAALTERGWGVLKDADLLVVVSC